MEIPITDGSKDNRQDLKEPQIRKLVDDLKIEEAKKQNVKAVSDNEPYQAAEQRAETQEVQDAATIQIPKIIELPESVLNNFLGNSENVEQPGGWKIPTTEKELDDRLYNHAYEIYRTLVKEDKNKLILKQAADPKSYETYESGEYDVEGRMQVYWARRKGRSHFTSNTPCQDYCGCKAGKHCLILTDADGVGSCDLSQVGSKAACETFTYMVLKEESQCADEEQFAERLESLDFRKRFVTAWKDNVVDDWNQNHQKPGNPKLTQKETLKHYGTTFTFVVITKNFYITGMVGDGQILLFNNVDGLKIRWHGVKEDTKTAALSMQRSYLENFKIHRYARKYYSAVLLSSDGIYDVLNKGKTFFRYASAATARFKEKQEPYLPFSLKINGELTDLYATYTQDDCSIIMAIDEEVFKPGISALEKEVLKTVPEAVLQRNYKGLQVYRALKNDGSTHLITVAKKTIPNHEKVVSETEQLNQEKTEQLTESKAVSAVSEKEPMEMLKSVSAREIMVGDKSYILHEYEIPRGLESLENAFDLGWLAEKAEIKGTLRDPYASLSILKTYRMLSKAVKDMKIMNRYFRQGAEQLIFISADGSQMATVPEAVSSNADEQVIREIFYYFHNLIGVLTCGKYEKPIFDTGLFTQGPIILDMKESANNQPGVMGPVIHLLKKDEYYLWNQSGRAWLTDNDAPVRSWPISKEKGTREDTLILLRNGTAFRVAGSGRYEFHFIDQEANGQERGLEE